MNHSLERNTKNSIANTPFEKVEVVLTKILYILVEKPKDEIL